MLSHPHYNHSAAQSATSPSSPPRKVSKPLMEKRRRARINNSLALLKSMVLDSHKKSDSQQELQGRNGKLEKADILELTVRHVQSLHSRENSPPHSHGRPDEATAETTALCLAQFKNGFAQCAREVAELTNTLEASPNRLDEREFKSVIIAHLGRCLSNLASLQVDMGTSQPTCGSFSSASSFTSSSSSSSTSMEVVSPPPSPAISYRSSSSSGSSVASGYSPASKRNSIIKHTKEVVAPSSGAHQDEADRRVRLDSDGVWRPW